MKPLTFTLRAAIGFPIDMRALRPGIVHGKTLNEISRLNLRSGNQSIPAGDVFDIHGEDYEYIVIENSTSMLEYVGSEHSNGTVEVHGDTGAFAGNAMNGGEITINGSVGDYAAHSMHGGRINIRGNAGNFLGAGEPGSKFGMHDGCVIVEGNAGNNMAEHMRRGLIAVYGNVGIGACSAMIAGSVVLLGESAQLPGIQMRRGTIFCTNEPVVAPALFVEQIPRDYTFLSLFFSYLQKLEIEIDGLGDLHDPVRRLVGDLGFGGYGEILFPVH